MSQLVSYTSTASIKQQGAKLGGATLSAAAGAAAIGVVSDGGTGILTITALAGQTSSVVLADLQNGHQFQGQPSITLTGAGAVLSLEWL